MVMSNINKSGENYSGFGLEGKKPIEKTASPAESIPREIVEMPEDTLSPITDVPSHQKIPSRDDPELPCPTSLEIRKEELKRKNMDNSDPGIPGNPWFRPSTLVALLAAYRESMLIALETRFKELAFARLAEESNFRNAYTVAQVSLDLKLQGAKKEEARALSQGVSAAVSGIQAGTTLGSTFAVAKSAELKVDIAGRTQALVQAEAGQSAPGAGLVAKAQAGQPSKFIDQAAVTKAETELKTAQTERREIYRSELQTWNAMTQQLGDHIKSGVESGIGVRTAEMTRIEGQLEKQRTQMEAIRQSLSKASDSANKANEDLKQTFNQLLQEYLRSFRDFLQQTTLGRQGA